LTLLGFGLGVYLTKILPFSTVICYKILGETASPAPTKISLLINPYAQTVLPKQLLQNYSACSQQH